MSEFSADRDQEVFDNAEEIALHLHHLRGCLSALFPHLEAGLALAPDKGVQAYALFAAVEHFAHAADQAAERVARAVSGVNA